MSGTAPPAPELTAVCHLLPMDPGLYCVSLGEPGSPPPAGSNLPAVRLSLPPGPQSGHDDVTISTFRPDGWLDMDRPAALVHVANQPARVLLTIYHQASQPMDAAPRLVIKQLGQLVPARAGAASPSVSGEERPYGPATSPVITGPVVTGFSTHTRSATLSGQTVTQSVSVAADALITAHIRNRGDVQVRLTEWVGSPGSRLWIEGFGIALPAGWGAGELEYQGIASNTGPTSWGPAPGFCGSRGQTLPLLGFALRLKGSAARLYDCSYRASFIDGSAIGPVPHGQLCQSHSQAALEAFQISLTRRLV